MAITSEVTGMAAIGQVQLTDFKLVNMQMNAIPQVPILVGLDHPGCFERLTCHIKQLAKVKEYNEKNKAICAYCIWPGR